MEVSEWVTQLSEMVVEPNRTYALELISTNNKGKQGRKILPWNISPKGDRYWKFHPQELFPGDPQLNITDEDIMDGDVADTNLTISSFT